jgi:hypothetical protein
VLAATARIFDRGTRLPARSAATWANVERADLPRLGGPDK